jgi:hypothetical protein
MFMVGMKSYGRAPAFLAATGYEQVRSVVAAIAGDDETAERVELTEIGVCGGAGVFGDPEGASRGEILYPARAQPITLSVGALN